MKTKIIKKIKLKNGDLSPERKINIPQLIIKKNKSKNVLIDSLKYL